LANPTLRRILAFAAASLVSATAHASLFRTYLASDGNDANACTLAAPCRLLPAALEAVVDGGEIWMLDSANYNTSSVVVTKSVSILAVPGAVGSVLAIGGPAISITAPGLRVALRNLAITPLPGGPLGIDGIFMTNGSTLTIENSLIANLTGNGVYVNGTGKLKVAQTIFRNVAGYAVRLENGASGEISGTQMLEGGFGYVLALANFAVTTTASVSDTVISGPGFGVYAFTSVAGAIARIVVTRCTIEGTDIALRSESVGGDLGTTLIDVSGSMIAHNGFAWWLGAGPGSVVNTLGNNHISQNAGSTGALTPIALQ
jgi:hypothetical protein